MQYPIQVEGIYAQTIQTIHPDVSTVVKFAYKADVFEDESVYIKQVSEVDGLTSYQVRITPKSEHESAMLRFLANIREHARGVAYAEQKAANKI